MPGAAPTLIAALAVAAALAPGRAVAQDRASEACEAYVSAGGAATVPPTADPEEVERLVSSALQATLLEDHETATQLLERARRLAPADPDVAFYLGRAQVAAGDSSAAIASYCAYLRLAPNAPDRGLVASSVAGLLDVVPAPDAATGVAAAERESGGIGALEVFAILGTILAMLLVLLAAGSDGARALAHARGSLIRRRRSSLGGLIAGAKRGISGAWMEHGLRDRGSTGRRLERLSEAIDRLGDREIATLERLEARLAAGATALTRVLGRRDREESPREGALLAQGGDSVAIVVLLTIVAVAVVALNTVLIRGAVAQALAGSTSFVFLDLDASFWVSLGLGLGALAAGLLWYAQESTEPESLHTVLFKATPFFVVIGLTAVQVLGYTVVSGRLDIPGRLSIDQGSLLYPVLQYVVVLIGALIPLSLATTGYSLLIGVRRVRVALGERGLRKALAARPEETVARIAAHAERFRTELVGGFRSAAGIGAREDQEESVALIVRQEIAALQKSGPEVVAVRPTTEVLGPFLMDLGVVVAWALVVGHTFQIFSQPGGGLDPLAWGVAALSACLAVTAAGIVAKRVLVGPAGLGASTPALPRGRPGRILLGLSAASGVLGGLLLLALAYGIRPLAPGPVLNLLYAGLLTLLLGLAAAALDDAVVALATLLRLAGHATVWLLAELATAASFVAETTLAALALIASGGAGSRRAARRGAEESGRA